VLGSFRRDLTLAPGPEFRLRRRPSARLYSALLALAAVAWCFYDLREGYRLVGAATGVLAFAFVLQLVLLERSAWRLEDTELRSRSLRIPVSDIEGVRVDFEGRTGRVWVEARGEAVALVEGAEDEARRIAERLAGTLRLATLPPPGRLH
jgi:hypothetical protein